MPKLEKLTRESNVSIMLECFSYLTPFGVQSLYMRACSSFLLAVGLSFDGGFNLAW